MGLRHRDLAQSLAMRKAERECDNPPEWFEIQEARKALDSCVDRLNFMQAEREEEHQRARRFRKVLEAIQSDMMDFMNPDKPDFNSIHFMSRCQIHLQILQRDYLTTPGAGSR